MSFFQAKFAARWAVLAVLPTLSLRVSAQQNIQFSKPTEDPTLKPETVVRETSHLNAANYSAPKPMTMFNLNNSGSFYDDLPGSPRPDVSPAAAAQWEKMLYDRKNWTLMTSEEILGIKTPEQILGIPDPNDESQLPADERFLKRQQRQEVVGASNAWLRADDSLRHNNLNNNNNDKNGSLMGDDSSDGVFKPLEGNTRYASKLEGSVPGRDRVSGLVFDRQSGDDAYPKPVASVWASPFNVPDALPKQTPEQLQGMEKFRALFDAPPPEKTSLAPGFAPLPMPAPDPNIQQFPVFNPAGTSIRALLDDIAKPTGLTPLPGVTGPQPVAKKAAPLVQPPPWMQNSLQNPTMPQRQF